jgi:hypothetical protein
VAAIGISSGTVIVLITVAVLPIAAVSFARAGRAWKGIGGGRFSIEQAPPPARSAAPEEPDRALQETEARQMLEAKAYRQRQRGQEGEIDVDAEVARLLDLDAERAGAGGHDEELRAEVRALVIARNERRARRGEEPLDVEAETDRQLADLIGLEGR